MENVWKPIETYGDRWATYRTLMKPIETYENIWKPMGNLWTTDGRRMEHRRKYMQNRRTSTSIYENLRKSMTIYENLHEIKENLRNSTKIDENQTNIDNKTQKLPNTEPQGVPEALDGTVG